jgi:hypothetical protein
MRRAKQEAPATEGSRGSGQLAQRPSQQRQAGLADPANLLAVSMFQKKKPGSGGETGLPGSLDDECGKRLRRSSPTADQITEFH